ncbi:hypothetical protein KU392_04410 [Advenella alkanexedens]|uniref:DUF2783 domain-containing protein n=1 Tax=Advenella alkanexedens TaxID=1481665 RepID=A0ABS6NLJ1_9BURK|nr:hypothetical protein [Advenella alkanexedens]MBV4396502.1 hypothetical protein [Advenella alkanexedens]
MELQRSFRAVTEALDQIPEAETEGFLARLALILANELADADRVENAVQRALAPVKTKEKEQ